VTEANVYPGPITTGPSGGVATSFGAASGCMSRRLDVGVGVPQPGQVGGPGPGVQVGEQAVIQGLALPRDDPAVGVVEVAEDDRRGGTGCLAGGQDLAVADPAILFLRVDPGPVDPLDAVGAFLHDAPRADGDVGVAQQFQALGGVVGVREEVEAADL